MSLENNEYFMSQALSLAQKAFSKDEVPVGCVIVHNNKIIARGYNLRERKKNALYHAEIMAINGACKKLKSWRLLDCTMYVTLEPCPMCAGAIINSRLPNLVFGAFDAKAGCFGSKHDFNASAFNHTLNVQSGVLSDECSNILKEFFAKKRG